MFNPEDPPRTLKEGISAIKRGALELVREAYTAIGWPLSSNHDKQVTEEIFMFLILELERKKPGLFSRSEKNCREGPKV